MDFDAEIKSPRPGVNDEMIVSLLRTNLEIQTYFKHTGHLLPNQGLFIHWVINISNKKIKTLCVYFIVTKDMNTP